MSVLLQARDGGCSYKTLLLSLCVLLLQLEGARRASES